MGKRLYVCKTYRVEYEEIGLDDGTDFFKEFLLMLAERPDSGIDYCDIDENGDVEIPADSKNAVLGWFEDKNPDDVVELPDNKRGITYGRLKAAFEKIFDSFDKGNEYIRLEWI